MELIDFLKRLKALKGSTEKAAREVGCSRQSFENWLRGDQPSSAYITIIKSCYERIKSELGVL